MGIHCAGPNRQHYVQKADQTIRTASKKEFSLARADCELQDTAMAVQEGQGIGAGRAENHKIFQRGALRATFGADGDRSIESVHGGGVIASSKSR